MTVLNASFIASPVCYSSKKYINNAYRARLLTRIPRECLDSRHIEGRSSLAMVRLVGHSLLEGSITLNGDVVITLVRSIKGRGSVPWRRNVRANIYLKIHILALHFNIQLKFVIYLVPRRYPFVFSILFQLEYLDKKSIFEFLKA
jgi:hypothetical protein